jgi:hypothetical protein
MMEEDKIGTSDKKGGIMKIFLAILLLLGVSVVQAVSDNPEYEGLMPAVEVVASRCDVGVAAYVGSLPEVDVTARRYEFEDDAWSGLMPETVVTAVRSAHEDLVYVGKPEFVQ